SAGADMLGIGAGAGTGGAFAATKAKARNGSATKALDKFHPLPSSCRRPRAGAAPTLARMLVEMALDVGRDRRGHELFDRAAVAGDFLDQVRCDRLERHVGHQEDRLDIVVQ